MGLYSQLSMGTPEGMKSAVESKGNRSAYDLAILTGSSPEEASLLSRQPDAMQFLESKWRRQQIEEKGEVPIGGPPGPAITPIPLAEGFRRTGADIKAGLGSIKDAIFPSGGEQAQGLDQFQAAQAQNTPVASPEEIMAQINQARQTDAMGYGQAPGGGEMPGAQSRALPASAEITDPGVSEQGGGMSEDKKAMLLRVLSGLSTAGQQMTSGVPTLADIRYGAGTQKPVQPETQLLGRAQEIEGEQKALKEGTDSQIVAEARRQAEAMGLDGSKIKTEKQARDFKAFTGAGAKQDLTKAQTGLAEAKAGAITGEAATDAAEAKLAEADMAAVADGDLSKLPKDAKKDLQDKKKFFYTNSRINGLKTQVDAAKSIKSRVDASESFGATSAFRALARAAGEVGIMTDRDIKDFSERMGIKGLYDRAYRFGKSGLSPELKEEIYKVAEAFSKDARENLGKEVDSRVGDLRAHYPYLTEESLRGYFVGDQTGAAEVETMDIILEDGSVKRGVSLEDGQAWIDAKKARRVGE